LRRIEKFEKIGSKFSDLIGRLGGIYRKFSFKNFSFQMSFSIFRTASLAIAVAIFLLDKTNDPYKRSLEEKFIVRRHQTQDNKIYLTFNDNWDLLSENVIQND
jgi:hypothetical protein